MPEKNLKNILKKFVRDYQIKREIFYAILQLCNQIRITSKQIITLLRRKKIEESEKLFDEIEKKFDLLSKEENRYGNLKSEGCYKEAIEEYMEAIMLYNFLVGKNKKFPQAAQIGPEEAVSGICDFTGELVRRAVTIAGIKTLSELNSYKEAMEDVISEVSKVGFTGKLRQKYDEAERNLKRIEDIIYDIRLKSKGE